VETANVEVFSDAVNSWIIRTPGRQYPALVIQGDTFSTFLASAQELLERARVSGDNGLIEMATEL
jgi:hypothetical protein